VRSRPKGRSFHLSCDLAIIAVRWEVSVIRSGCSASSSSSRPGTIAVFHASSVPSFTGSSSDESAADIDSRRLPSDGPSAAPARPCSVERRRKEALPPGMPARVAAEGAAVATSSPKRAAFGAGAVLSGGATRAQVESLSDLLSNEGRRRVATPSSVVLERRLPRVLAALLLEALKRRWRASSREGRRMEGLSVS